MAEYLLFYSGGMDSFLTADKLLCEGNTVHLITFDNGAVAKLSNAIDGYNRLFKRYGHSVKYDGVYNTSALISRCRYDMYTTRMSELPSELLGVSLAQVQCMMCQSCMWMAAIAYAKAHNISNIATGYKKIDPFCTASAAWLDCMRTLADQYNICVFCPLSDYPADVTEFMWEHHYIPQVSEPKCLLGLPCKVLDKDEEECLMQVYRLYVRPVEEKQIASLIQIFKSAPLGMQSLL